MGGEAPVTGQGTLDGMPRRLYPATPTRLTTWLDCPRRYRFAYLDRPPPPKGPPWAHNTVGAAVHVALADFWRLPLERRTVDAAGALVDRAWRQDGFRDSEQADVWRHRSREMVTRYVAGLDPDVEPRGVERTVALVHGGAALSGRVDRIDERGPELVVVDYKTGRHVLTTDDARSSLALAIYAAAATRTLRTPCRRVELHHLPTGEVVTWDHDDSSLARHLGRAEQIAAECAEADQAFRGGKDGDDIFPPRPSPLCGWCDFRRHCPEGQARVPDRPSWGGLATD
jgi:RecB family exonuclease